MSEEVKRVVFDFEIDFTNGGGIQGQDFRLDIAGDDISDRELAGYIVKDMRLLMVGEVRILNKRGITEPHKRRPVNAESDSPETLLDLSHTIRDGLVTYPRPLSATISAGKLQKAVTRPAPSFKSAKSRWSATPALTSTARSTATLTARI